MDLEKTAERVIALFIPELEFAVVEGATTQSDETPMQYLLYFVRLIFELFPFAPN